MCVYLTYVLSTHTTYAALKAAGACAFLGSGLRGTSGAQQGDGPASPLALMWHCPPWPASQDFCPAQHRHRTTVPPKCVRGGGTLLRSPGSAGLGLLVGRSVARLSPVQVGSVGCTGLPVLLSSSFISLCVLINQTGLLPAGINLGWICGGGEAPWGMEGASVPGKHSSAPGTHKTSPPSPWGLCHSRFWSKITWRRGFWAAALSLSPWRVTHVATGRPQASVRPQHKHP